MCVQCDKLKKELEEEKMRPRLSPKNWWAGIVVTIAIFIITTIYASGKITSQVEEHIATDPTFKEMVETFVTRVEAKERDKQVDKDIDEIKRMIEYLYRKEGGK